MSVGFFIDYQRSDECLAVIQLATVLEDLGHSVQFFPSDRAEHLSPKWDAKVRRSPKVSFMDWIKGLSHLVFCDMPPQGVVKAVKDLGIKAYFLCSWNNLKAEHLPQLPEFDRVICPARAVSQLIRDACPDAHAVRMPWCVALPTTRSNYEIDAKRLGLVWHLDGTQPLYQSSAFLPLLKKLVQPPHVYLTVFYTSRMPEDSIAMLKELSLKLDGRMEMVKNADWERQVLTTAAHDLTLWPSLMENFGMPGLLSLASGTPVVGFDHPIVGEVVKHEVNGVLVPCGLQFDAQSVPSVIFDDKLLLKTTQDLLLNVQRLAALKKNAQLNQNARRVQFEAIVKVLFNA